MRNITTKLFRCTNISLITILAIILINFSKGIAQPYFQPSSVNEDMISGTPSPAHIYDVTCNSYQNAMLSDGITSDLYISTWYAAPHSGLYWKRTIAGTPSSTINEGLINLTYGAFVFDAAIIYNPNNVSGVGEMYGLAVVYRDPSGGHIALYEWTAAGGPVLISSTMLTANNTITRMSIDAHWLYCYSVAWSFSNGDMYSFGAYSNQTTFLIKQIQCPINISGHRPDVAMNHGGTVGSGLKTYYSYVIDNDRIGISWIDFDDLIDPLVPPPLTLNSASTSTLDAFNSGFGNAIPKIDAPEHWQDHWAVVANDYDWVNQESYILTVYDLFPNIPSGTIKLNDGTRLGTDPMFDGSAGMYPSIPAVAFDKDGALLHYAWGKTIDHPDLGDHDYIGMLYDPSNGTNGDAVPGSNGAGYRIIDFDPNYNPTYRAIALTGQNEYSNDLFIVFSADDIANTFYECLYTKHIDWNNIPAIGYRSEKSNPDETNCSDKLIQHFYPNPIQDKGLTLVLNEMYIADYLEVNIYDITGRKLHNHKGSIEEINNALRNIATNAAKGLWTVQLISHTSGKSESVRVSVQ